MSRCKCAFLGMLLISSSALAQSYTHRVPPDRADGWVAGSLRQARLDHDQVRDVICDLGYAHGTSDFRSLLAARHGILAVEQYFNSYAEDTVHDVRSAGKTFTGALVGIAIDRGLIGSVDDPVVPYFEALGTPANLGDGKRSITFEHLLTMSSGLHADADDPGSPGFEARLKDAADFTRFVIDLPMQFQPGSRYQYNSATAYLAGAAVEQVSGRSLSEFADLHLFGPLGIREYYWTRGPGGTTYGMGGLYLRARDLAKLGQLFLDDGKWGGRQVISSEWVEGSLESRFELDIAGGLQTGYGRLWLVSRRPVLGRELNVYFASGNGGNVMAIVPELSLVVAVQQSAYGRGYGHFRAFTAIDGIIKAALLSDREESAGP